MISDNYEGFMHAHFLCEGMSHVALDTFPYFNSSHLQWCRNVFVSHRFCKFSHLKRGDKSVMSILDTLQLWERDKKIIRKSQDFICVMEHKINICSITKVLCCVTLVSMTDVQWIFTMFTHFSSYFGSFLHADLLKSSSSSIDSIRLQSTDWLDQIRTFNWLLCNHSFVAWAMCLGCWKTQPHFILNVLADRRRFLSKTSPYMSPLIILFCLQSMTLPPPCFTVDMVFLRCSSTFFPLQTW